MQEFEFNLEDNLFALHESLINKTYRHSPYVSFYVQDPKLRHIHKACVADRVVHQAVFRILYPIFDGSFIFDSYSCRFQKGVHRGVSRLESFARKASKHSRRPICALKCDVRKFFDSIDQKILKGLICEKIKDDDALWLIKKIIDSFQTDVDVGLPLGNVTSQLFANIYLNQLDQFVKHKLREKYYLRYCDDFIILHNNADHLEEVSRIVDAFLLEELSIRLHEDKIVTRKHSQGIDFLGFVALPHHRVLRTKTKKRILRKVAERRLEMERGKISINTFQSSLQSYLGILTHCKGFKIRKKIESDI